MRVTTRDRLRNKVAFLQKQGFDIAIGWAYGGPRCTTMNESRDLSPRLTAREMVYWLDGFITALDAPRKVQS